MNERVHELKTWPRHFEAAARGEKPFEVRRNDRGFAVGDTLHLREWQPHYFEDGEWNHGGHYTGREFRARVTFVLEAPADGDIPYIGLEEGFCVMGIKPYIGSEFAALGAAAGAGA